MIKSTTMCSQRQPVSPANSASGKYNRTKYPGILILIIVLTFAVGFAGEARGTDIGIDLGPAGKLRSDVAVSFDALNGISLTGESLSLDFFFSY